MSSRNMIEAHTCVFKSLDLFCSRHNDPVSNADAPRWIQLSGRVDKERLLNAKLNDCLSFADSLKISRFDHGEISLFCTVGLNLPEEIGFLQEEDFGGGMLTAILSELTPPPVKSTVWIRNVVEAEDKLSNPNYKGHAHELIAQLFPPIKCFSVKNLAEEETQRVFFLLSLSAASRATLWMDSRLRETLELIAALSPVAIPYRTLCRSIFDTDPSALFMALYRCLEALYAYSHTTKLMDQLKIPGRWTDVAQVLEETLSWRPREEPSLGNLLRHAVPDDLRAILEAIGESRSDEGDIFKIATKRVYSLRNKLVHYRPFHQGFQADAVDWNRLCEATALLVLHVYDSVKAT